MKINSILAGMTVAAMLGGAMPAGAADLAARGYTKARPPVASVYDWTGFHVGVNGAYLSSETRWDLGPAPFAADGSNKGTGFFGGAQLGYDIQAGAWVFGVEAQGDWGELSGQHLSLVNDANLDRAKVDGVGLFTARVGYAFDNVLFYAKGGAAVTHNKYAVLDAATEAVLATGSDTRWGGAAGAGVEVAFSTNWSASVDYVHGFFDRKTLAFAPAGFGSYAIRQDFELVSFHVNYRFGGPQT